jgi:sugar phosphate isomerase/epimerase
MQSRRRPQQGENPGDRAVSLSGDESWVNALPHEPGVQNWEEVFRAFRRCGYDGWVTVIENRWPASERKAVAATYAEFVRATWEKAL